MEEIDTKPATTRERVFIVEGALEEATADVIVVTAQPGLENGFGWFDYVKEHAGPEFEEALKKYKHCGVGSSRLLPSFEYKNFKAIAFLVMPPNFRMDATSVEAQRIRAFCKNTVDIAAEEEYSSIIFPSSLNNDGIDWVAPVLMRSFKEWARESPYIENFTEIRILCTSHEDYEHYVNAANRMTSTKRRYKANDEYDDDMAVEEPVAPTSKSRRRGEPLVPIPHEDIEHMKSNGMFLVLSAKLEPTILNLKDQDGKKRQYRMTNRSRDGRKLYFRCSRCDTLAKKCENAVRARLIICNGEVMGDEFPTHHADCEPWTDEQLLVQQIDRSSRKTVKEGLLQPFEAYQDALTRISSVVANDSNAIELPKFPEWNQVRHQYFRIKKRADREGEEEEEIPERMIDETAEIGYEDE
uniref:Macro domain-containing protein n=1 Tax=Panagrolaimus superbus TaxID=310955 RepID=A0A914YMP5_9BILA